MEVRYYWFVQLNINTRGVRTDEHSFIHIMWPALHSLIRIHRILDQSLDIITYGTSWTHITCDLKIASYFNALIWEQDATPRLPSVTCIFAQSNVISCIVRVYMYITNLRLSLAFAGLVVINLVVLNSIRYCFPSIFVFTKLSLSVWVAPCLVGLAIVIVL